VTHPLFHSSPFAVDLSLNMRKTKHIIFFTNIQFTFTNKSSLQGTKAKQSKAWKLRVSFSCVNVISLGIQGILRLQLRHDHH